MATLVRLFSRVPTFRFLQNPVGRVRCPSVRFFETAGSQSRASPEKTPATAEKVPDRRQMEQTVDALEWC